MFASPFCCFFIFCHKFASALFVRLGLLPRISAVPSNMCKSEVKPYIMYKNTKFESSAKTHFLVIIQGFTSLDSHGELAFLSPHGCQALSLSDMFTVILGYVHCHSRAAGPQLICSFPVFTSLIFRGLSWGFPILIHNGYRPLEQPAPEMNQGWEPPGGPQLDSFQVPTPRAPYLKIL